MVRPAGVEPAAFPLGGGRSIQLSYRGFIDLSIDKQLVEILIRKIYALCFPNKILQHNNADRC